MIESKIEAIKECMRNDPYIIEVDQNLKRTPVLPGTRIFTSVSMHNLAYIIKFMEEKIKIDNEKITLSKL